MKFNVRRYVIAPVFLIAALVMCSLGGTELLDDMTLRQNARNTDAKITNVRKAADNSYEIQYEFTVDGRKYSRSDATGRRNLWVSVDGKKTDTVKIIYNEKNPWANRLAEKDPFNMNGVVGPLMFGIVLFPGMAFYHYRKSFKA